MAATATIEDHTIAGLLPPADATHDHPTLRPHLEWDASEACPIGRDPRQLGADGLRALGLEREPLLAAVRRNCIECAGGSQAEVRRCGQVECPMWAWRMNFDPWRAQPSEERKEAFRRRMAAARERSTI